MLDFATRDSEQSQSTDFIGIGCKSFLFKDAAMASMAFLYRKRLLSFHVDVMYVVIAQDNLVVVCNPFGLP